MEKARRYALFLPLALFILAIFLLTGLYNTMSGWLIIAVIIVIPAIIVFLIPKEPSETEEEEEVPAQAPQTPAGQTLGQRVVGYGTTILVLIALVILAAIIILYATGSADRSFNTTELKKMCSGGCQISGDAIILSKGTLKIPNNDFGEIAIYLTEKLSVGSVMDVSIGPHKVHIVVGKCQYSMNPTCYVGEWWYTASSPEVGETYVGGEIQYAEASLLPFKVTKGYPDLIAIMPSSNLNANLGDKLLVNSLRTKEMTPQPVIGTIKITCSKCSIKEVKIYYALPNRLRNILIGWI